MFHVWVISNATYQHAETTPNPQQHRDMLQIRCSGGGRDGEICRRDEGEEKDEADEDEHEGDVDAERADEEDEADNTPVRMLGKLAFNQIQRQHLHGHIMKGLRSVIRRPFQPSHLRKGSSSLMDGILRIRQRTPMRAENDKHGEGIRIPQDKLGDAGKNHPNRSEEVVVAAQTCQARRRRCTAPADEDENRARVRDQEADQAQEGRVAESLRQVAARGSRGLEEETFVLIRAH